MNFAKATVNTTIVAAIALGASLTAANAKVKKRDARNFVYGAAATAVILSAVKEDCKKWKHRYNRTGNPYFLDRYYACI